jgi:hypothetical protein
VSAPTFRVAAGAVLAVAGIRWVIVGAKPMDEQEPRALTLLPRFFTPPLLAIAITVGVDDGVVTASVAGAVALAGVDDGVVTASVAGAVALAAAVVAAIGRGQGLVWWSWSARLIGLAGVAVGLALVVDGVKTV